MPYIPFPRSPLFQSKQKYIEDMLKFIRDKMDKGIPLSNAQAEWKWHLQKTGKYWPAGPFGPSWDSKDKYLQDLDYFVEDLVTRNLRYGRRKAEEEWYKGINDTVRRNKEKYHATDEYRKLLEDAWKKRSTRKAQEEMEQLRKEKERKRKAANIARVRKTNREIRRGLQMTPHLRRKIR